MIQLSTQLNPLIYSSLSPTIKLGLAPPLDHNSNHILASLIVFLSIDQDKFSKQVNDIGKTKQDEFKKVNKTENANNEKQK